MLRLPSSNLAQKLRTWGIVDTLTGMEHTDWMQRITRGDSYRRVAELAGINDRTLANQMRAGELKPEMIIKIAEAYDESPVYALVDLGFISAKWLQEMGTSTALSRATDEELTDELLVRLKLIEDKPVDELAARRSNKGAGHVGTVPYGAVADSSPDEDALREAEEGDVD